MSNKQIMLGDKECVEANHVAWPQVRQCNSFYLPLGHEPGVAHVLMRYEQLKPLIDHANETSSDNHIALTFRSGPTPAVECKFKKLYFGSAKRVAPGPENSQNAVYHVTLYDKRYLAKHFSPPLTFDICASATDSWSGVAQKLWESMTFLGTWPTLPYTPYSKPMWLKWLYLPTWQSLSILLGQIGCAVAYNPFTDVFTIARLGDSQSLPLPPNTDTYRSRTLSGNATVYPEKVRVRFPGGTTTLNTSKTGALAGTIQSFVEHRDPANATEQTNRATEIRDKWLEDRAVPSEKYVVRGLFSAILPAGQVKAVLWRDYGQRPCDMDGGLRTELLTQPGLQTPIIDPDQPLPHLFAKSKTGGIPVESGGTLGAANVDVYQSDIDNAVTDASFDLEAVNVSGIEVEENKNLIIGPVQGRYATIVEGCTP